MSKTKKKTAGRRGRTNAPIKHGNGWRIRWVDEGGKRRSLTFDEWDDADLELKRKLVEVEERRRGLRALAPKACTFRDASERWMDVHGRTKRSRKTDESFLRRHLLPAFGDMQLAAIDRTAVAHFCKAREHLTANTVNHHLSLLITVLRYAHAEGLLDNLPRIKKPKVAVDDADFSFLRTQDEIARFLAAARDMGPQMYLLVAVPLAAGLRLGEVCGLETADLDLDDRRPFLHVRRSYDGPTKNGRKRRVPLQRYLLPDLRAWVGSSQGLLFTNERGKLLRRDAPWFRTTRRFGDVLEAAGFERNYITYHDLRHTFVPV